MARKPSASDKRARSRTRKATPRRPAARARRPKGRRATTDARAELYRDLEFVPAVADAPRARARGVRRGPPARAESLGELTRKLRAEHRKNPDRVLDELSRAVGEPVPEVQFLRTLAILEGADEDPETYLAATDARREALARVCKPPAGLPPDVDACGRRYEMDDTRWITRTAKYILQRILGTFEVAPFRRHESFPNRFDYRLKDRDGRPIGADERIVVALFSDFGTGEYQSLYTANEIAKDRPLYAIHLGDVYYVGEPQEFEKHFVEPLAEVRKRSRFFTLNANHEMYFGGFAYFDFLDANRALPMQEQEGSYFRLWSERYQIIGIDTAHDYRNNGELRDAGVRAWLKEKLAEGKGATPPRTNILLSQNEPFGLGEKKAEPLFDQVTKNPTTRDGGSMIDFWFWGDEHYCALFQGDATVPFVGSCIGNAGHPVNRRKLQRQAERDAERKGFAKAAWIDDSPRFPNFRKDDLGNTGYCLMTLDRDGVGLQYKDWQGETRKAFRFDAAGRVVPERVSRRSRARPK